MNSLKRIKNIKLRVTPVRTERNAKTTQIGQCGNPITDFPI